MSKLYKGVAVISVIVVALVGSALAATKSKGNAAPADKPASKYATSPFDLVSVMPPSYLGHSCTQVAAGLAALKIKKDEFETTAAYKQRVEQLRDRPLVGSLMVSDNLAFRRSDDMPMMVKYDADRGVLSLRSVSLRSQYLKTEKYERVQSEIIDYKQDGKRQYEASNSYGKKVTVTSTTYSVCALTFVNRPMFKLGANMSRDDFVLPLAPEEARAVKDDLQIYYVGHLVNDLLGEYGDYREPKIDSPREEAWSGPALMMNLDYVLLTQKSTNKLLATLDISTGALRLPASETKNSAPVSACSEVESKPDGTMGCKS